jgi:SAM-dependent methyltransferase
VINIGAGAGSYEPSDRRVVAVEPALTMIRQREPGAAPVVRAVASALPFRDASFDAALAVLTVHHWPDREGGLRELVRVARQRVVVFTHETAQVRFWLERYFPATISRRRRVSTYEVVKRVLGSAEVIVVPVPRDCSDGFLGAYWARPEAYLDPGVRNAISGFAHLSDAELAEGLARLRADLESGAWEREHGALREREALDLGYRLVVGTGSGR